MRYVRSRAGDVRASRRRTLRRCRRQATSMVHTHIRADDIRIGSSGRMWKGGGSRRSDGGIFGVQDTCGKLDGRVWRFPGEEQHPAGLAGISEMRWAPRSWEIRPVRARQGSWARGDGQPTSAAVSPPRCPSPTCIRPNQRTTWSITCHPVPIHGGSCPGWRPLSRQNRPWGAWMGSVSPGTRSGGNPNRYAGHVSLLEGRKGGGRRRPSRDGETVAGGICPVWTEELGDGRWTWTGCPQVDEPTKARSRRCETRGPSSHAGELHARRLYMRKDSSIPR
eukprot:scaffold2044_cov305-Pavlova_lutheri.AAC.20